MVEYAQIECHDCFGIFPGNVMRRKSQSKASGRSVQASNPFDEDSIRHSIETATTHYEHSEIMLCPNCRSKRRLRKLLKFALVAAVVSVGIYWYMVRSEPSGSDYNLGTNSGDYSETIEPVEGDLSVPVSGQGVPSADTAVDITNDELSAAEPSQSEASEDAVSDDSELALAAPQTAPEVVRFPLPIGNRDKWVSEDDYPRQAMRDGRDGTTGFRLDVDENGRASNCQITRSSGSTDLDAATCRGVMNKSRFQPAIDAEGKPISSTYASNVTWQLPDKP